LLYVVLRMRLVPGKALLFVNSVERCYRVKLFLDQFGISAWCVPGAAARPVRHGTLSEAHRSARLAGRAWGWHSVLNAELPQNTRYHIVQEFNRGVYDVIVATDEASRVQSATAAAAAATAAAAAGAAAAAAGAAGADGAAPGERDGLPLHAQPGGVGPDDEDADTAATYVAVRGLPSLDGLG
jgi:ATP-dependent RNA helicase DDX56/DBP9